jgi:hypothetical protein
MAWVSSMVNATAKLEHAVVGDMVGGWVGESVVDAVGDEVVGDAVGAAVGDDVVGEVVGDDVDGGAVGP